MRDGTLLLAWSNAASTLILVKGGHHRQDQPRHFSYRRASNCNFCSLAAIATTVDLHLPNSSVFSKRQRWRLLTHVEEALERF